MELGDTLEDLEYDEGVYPVVFNCQFIYRYDDHLEAYAANLRKKVAETLYRRFKQNPVFADARGHKYRGPCEAFDKPSVRIRLLVDFPWDIITTRTTYTYHNLSKPAKNEVTKMPYACTIYRTMCPTCRQKYVKLINQGVQGDYLEYNPETYPIVFKALFEHPDGIFASAEAHGRHLLRSIKVRLNERFNKDISLFGDLNMSQDINLRTGVESGVLVHVSLLVDFPYQGLGNEEFMRFLRSMAFITREIDDWSCMIEIEEGLRDWLFGGLSEDVEDWEAFVSSTQDHLCMSRLCWFIKRAGLANFL
ncbi:uncharacterized protein BDV17DRAFT_288844 [Aspergillus undulatus]|uniref:uncharacterized protein n=1 Tax=Aspergillus undulatus TaxID=1810928 RepID=UPI003CCD9747